MDAKARNASVHWFIVRGCFLSIDWATSTLQAEIVIDKGSASWFWRSDKKSTNSLAQILVLIWLGSILVTDVMRSVPTDVSKGYPLGKSDEVSTISDWVGCWTLNVA